MTLNMGSIGVSSAFSEHGYVANQIKENHECSNMVENILIVENILPAEPPPPDPTDGVNGSNFNFLSTWSCCISHLLESKIVSEYDQEIP